MLPLKDITVNAQLVDHLLVGARHCGIDVSSLLSRCGVSQLDLETTGKRVPVVSAVKLAHLCTLEMEDEAQGLLAKPLPRGALRLTALSAGQTKTIKSALQRYIDFINFFQNTCAMRLARNGRQAIVIYDRIPNQTPIDDVAIPYMMTIMHRLLGWLANMRIVPLRIHLDIPKPVYSSEFQYIFFGAPILFDQPEISISFDASHLDYPILQTEQAIEHYVQRAPLDVYLPMSLGGELSMQIAALVNKSITEKLEPPRLADVAVEFDMTVQNLRKKLKSEGTSFHTIVSQARRDIAIFYLTNDEMTVEFIAERTGYTEPSAFIRAFKQWTGLTPLQFKKGKITDIED
ncbi:MAG: AraC family transcriptional regulator ligand-binding domain-containing protein [Pseudomonadota bacterium]